MTLTVARAPRSGSAGPTVDDRPDHSCGEVAGSEHVDYRAGVATHTVSRSDRRAGSSRWTRAVRLLGTLSIVAGLLLAGWAFVVWQWGDPVTSVYTSWEQRRLDSELATLTRDRPPLPPVAEGETPAEAITRVRNTATTFRHDAKEGDAIGRLRVPRLGVDMVIVEGTDAATLRRGPGRHARTFMPGEGKLVYLAGHRTTYSAPFADIDTLRKGDRITVEMPYGTFVYAVQRRRIVDDQELAVLRSGRGEEVALQACHPRFFGTQRYIVWAAPVHPRALQGRRFAMPERT